MKITVRVATVGLLFVALTGCYVQEDPEPQSSRGSRDTEREPERQAAPAGSEVVGRGGGSTLGGAKRSAKGTIGKLEARDREIQRQLEEDN